MSIGNWNHLLPGHSATMAMTPEQLKQGSETAKSNAVTIAFGISAIGNLLACTADNKETGLCHHAVTDIGWMLESLGRLTAQLVESGDDLEYHLEQRTAETPKPKATGKPAKE